MKLTLVKAAVILTVLFSLTACKEEEKQASSSQFSADWDAIAIWPGDIPENAEPEPDPHRATTIIILDDSGSMGDGIQAAKAAVITNVQSLKESDYVGVYALNAGEILPIMTSEDASSQISRAIKYIRSDGNTPLGASLATAYQLIRDEAGYQRGFGTYRIVVTTDGAASDEEYLEKMMIDILTSSPVELATIGLGIGPGHILNLPGITTYVSIDNVEDLSAALAQVSAEQTDFQPITDFEEISK